MRWWCRFIDNSKLPLLLFKKDELPLNKAAQERVETQLLLFTMFLCRVDPPILGITIDSYVGHVKAVHVHMTGGLAFKDVLVCSQRLKSLKRKLKSLRPSTSRTKVGFEASNYAAFSKGARAAKAKGAKAFATWVDSQHASHLVKGKGKKKRKKTVPKDVAFLADRIVLGVSVAMTALLRSSELVDNKYKSAANRAPIMLSDLRFVRIVRGEETEIEMLDDGTLGACPAQVHFIECRMPPSKSDPIQRQGNELIFPQKIDPVHDIDGAMENIINFMNDYPIPRAQHSITPLLRDKRDGVQRQIRRTEFIRDFKWICREAGLQYSKWGTHAFRVGGMNALQDAGASVPEIMALGHWRSDAWLLYSRRNRPRLQEWSKQILRLRQPGDIRNGGAIKRAMGAGTDSTGRYITINGRQAALATGLDVENDIDWVDNEVVECD